MLLDLSIFTLRVVFINAKKFDRLYVERINSLSPYIRSIPDDDMRQEALIGVFEALNKDPNGTDSFLINSAKWKQNVALRKGRSVDNGFYKRDELPIVHYDQYPGYDGFFAQVISGNGRVPLDDRVIDKICLEKLIEDLTPSEMEVLNYKVMDELYDKEIRKKLRIGHERLKGIKDGLRDKIEEAFGEYDIKRFQLD